MGGSTKYRSLVVEKVGFRGIETMDRYVRKRVLGKGSYGSAYLVESRGDPSRLFVIKEVVVGHLPQKEREMAQQEADVLSQMSHSNIVTCHESFIEGDKLYIAMDYADGGDLSKAIELRKQAARPFTEVEIMNILVQLLLGLRHVHSNKILHRDLKAQNIFLTSSGIVKLGDFGVARKMDASTDLAKTQIGTPYYLAPEIWEARPYGKTSDVWSLGVILYELLALELPFKATTLPTLVQQILSQAPPPVSLAYSQHIQVLVYSMLAKEPSQRPSVTQILKSPYIQAYISMQISYTIERGTGGAESDAIIAAEGQTPPLQVQTPSIQAETKASRGGGGGHQVQHRPIRSVAGAVDNAYRGRQSEEKAGREDAADSLRQDFIARQNQARQNRLKAEGDLYGDDAYSVEARGGRGEGGRQQGPRQQTLPQQQLQQQQQIAPFQQQEYHQQQRNDLRPPARHPIVRYQGASERDRGNEGAGGWGAQQREDAAVFDPSSRGRARSRSSDNQAHKEEQPSADYKYNREGVGDGQGMSDADRARAQAQMFKQRIEEDLWGVQWAVRKEDWRQQQQPSAQGYNNGEDRVIQMRQASALERQRAIAEREEELAKAHLEVLNEKRRLHQKLQERKRAESISPEVAAVDNDDNNDALDMASPQSEASSGRSPLPSNGVAEAKGGGGGGDRLRKAEAKGMGGGRRGSKLGEYDATAEPVVVVQRRRSSKEMGMRDEVKKQGGTAFNVDFASPSSSSAAAIVLEEKEKAKRDAEERKQLELARARNEVYQAGKELKAKMERQKKQQEEEEARRNGLVAAEEEEEIEREREQKQQKEQQQQEQQPQPQQQQQQQRERDIEQKENRPQGVQQQVQAALSSPPAEQLQTIAQQQPRQQQTVAAVLPLQVSLSSDNGAKAEDTTVAITKKPSSSTPSSVDSSSKPAVMVAEAKQATTARPKRSFFSFFKRRSNSKTKEDPVVVESAPHPVHDAIIDPLVSSLPSSSKELDPSSSSSADGQPSGPPPLPSSSSSKDEESRQNVAQSAKAEVDEPESSKAGGYGLQKECDLLHKRHERSKSLTEMMEKVTKLVDELQAKGLNIPSTTQGIVGEKLQGGGRGGRGGKDGGSDDRRKELLALAQGLVSALCVPEDEDDDDC